MVNKGLICDVCGGTVLPGKKAKHFKTYHPEYKFTVVTRKNGLTRVQCECGSFVDSYGRLAREHLHSPKALSGQMEKDFKDARGKAMHEALKLTQYLIPPDINALLTESRDAIADAKKEMKKVELELKYCAGYEDGFKEGVKFGHDLK